MIKFLAKFLEKLYRTLKIGRLIGYVNSGDSLPPPLSPAEEAELMTRLLAGDTDVRQTLIERNLRLVVYIARKFETPALALRILSPLEQ